MSGLQSSLEREDLIHIFGYPVSKRGELWGDSKQVSVFKANKKTNLVQYDLPTTGGQSGSPIIRVTQNTTTTIEMSMRILGAVLFAVFIIIFGVCNRFGFESGSGFDIAILMSIITFICILYAENSLNLSIIPKETVINRSKSCNIVGVHTTGNDTGNIGVKLTKDSLGWIKQNVTDSYQNDNTEADDNEDGDDSFYCLKETPFL